MAKPTVRWLGSIKTDLSVPLTGLDRQDIKVLCLDSEDDLWAEQFADIISEDALSLSYGMRSPNNVYVRDIAVHVANRFNYYLARQRTTDSRVHRLLDDLLLFGTPSEGVIPVMVNWTDDQDIQVSEYLGKYNFQASLVHEAFDALRHRMPFEPISTDRYEVK